MKTVDEVFVLYKIFKHIVPAGYNITYMQKDDYAEKQCGFMESGSQISEYRDQTTGRMLEHIIFITLDVTGYAGRSGAITPKVWMENVRDILLEEHNKLYYVLEKQTADNEPDCDILDDIQSGSYEAFIRQVDILSEPVFNRYNKQDFPVYTLDLKIIYKVGGN